jgi:thiopurine S-methyltransferase
MEGEFWLDKWQRNEIGFHQPQGHLWLRQYWPSALSGARVLVPLCGKSVDLLWLAEQGCDVTGVELSQAAVTAFFAENNLDYQLDAEGAFSCYRAKNMALAIYCGDFFNYTSEPFDALFDRAALVAMPKTMRPDYVAHCQQLLSKDAYQLLISFVYDQDKMTGPPFSVPDAEMRQYWGEALRLLDEKQVISESPRFRDSGLDSLLEKVWEIRSP